MSAERPWHSFVLRSAPWGLALGSCILLSIGKRGLFGAALFVLMTLVASLALLHAVRRLNIFAAGTLVFFGVILLFLAAFLLRFAPYLGYLGQIMAVLQPLLLAITMISVPLLFLWPKIRFGRLGFSELVIVAQIILLLSQLGVVGAARFLPKWQARGLEVQIITVSGHGTFMCRPLVEGNIAYMANDHYQGSGTLYQVDIASGEVLQQINFTGFTPEELGHPDWQDWGGALQIEQGVLNRQDEHTLTLQYPTRFSHGDSLVETPLSIKLTFDLQQGIVSKWEKFEGEEAQAGFVPIPERTYQPSEVFGQVGEYQISWQDAKLHFRSPDRHFLLRCGLPGWVKTLDDGTVLMDQGGRLYIIRLKTEKVGRDEHVSLGDNTESSQRLTALFLTHPDVRRETKLKASPGGDLQDCFPG